MSSRQCGCAAPVMNHLRPLITRSSPSRRTVVCRLVGSDEATSGSLIAKAERMRPSSSGAATGALRGRGKAVQQLDVAGVGRAAVEHLGRPGQAAHGSASGA
jgi:hypothetical protein